MTSQFERLAIHCGILAVAVAAALAGVRFLPFLQLTETWLADFRIASLSRPRPQDANVVVLAVTEDTLAQFTYRSPLDRGFVTGLVTALAARNVRAIGLDILFDQPTEPANDEALKATLRELPVPLVASYAGTDDGLTERQAAYLDQFVPPANRGFANLVKDTLSDTVRAVYPGRRISDGTFVRGFAGALAEKLGIEPPEVPVPIAWRPRPDSETLPFRTFPAHLLGALPAAWFEGKVILVGADLGLSDRHRTPFSVLGAEGRSLTGIEVHAHALSQLMAGSKPPAPEPWGQLVLAAVAASGGIALAFIHANLVARAAITVVSLGFLLIGGFGAYRYAGALVPIIEPGLALVIGLWLTDAYHGHSERRQRRFLKDAFSRYLSPVLVNQLVADPRALSHMR